MRKRYQKAQFSLKSSKPNARILACFTDTTRPLTMPYSKRMKIHPSGSSPINSEIEPNMIGVLTSLMLRVVLLQ